MYTKHKWNSDKFFNFGYVCNLPKDYDPSKKYEDGGVSFETYINARILELEALGPVERVAAGETAELAEKWSLVKNPRTPDARDDEALDRFWNEVWQA